MAGKKLKPGQQLKSDITKFRISQKEKKAAKLEAKARKVRAKGKAKYAEHTAKYEETYAKVAPRQMGEGYESDYSKKKVKKAYTKGKKKGMKKGLSEKAAEKMGQERAVKKMEKQSKTRRKSKEVIKKITGQDVHAGVLPGEIPDILEATYHYGKADITESKSEKKARKLETKADIKRYKAAKLYQKQKNIDKYRREGKIKAKGGVVGDSIKTYNQGGYVEGK